MKICIATDAWRPQVSGVVTTLENIIREVRCFDHEIMCIHPGQFKRTIPCPTYPQIRLALNPNRTLKRILHQFDPDHIHIMTEGPIGLSCRLYCNKKGYNFTSSFTTRFDEYIHLRFGMPKTIIFNLLKWFHAASSNVMVATHQLKNELDAKGFIKTVVCPKGVDTSLFRIRSKSFLKEPRPIFIYVGRVALEKNIESFLKLDLPGTKLVVGDGPHIIKLKAKYPQVKFVGMKRGEELAKFYSAADVFVFPSKTDTFGLVMLEAMACGIPVAAYPVRGPIDIINQGENGYTNNNLAIAATKALELDKDKCRNFALQFSWEKTGEYFVNHLIKKDEIRY
jgi:glycosyltransferase involved in cell wall biosynthesis